MRQRLLLFGLYSCLLSVGVEAQLVPSSRLAQSNWQAAGMLAEGGIPTRTSVCQTVDAGTYGTGVLDATAAIQAAIDHASCTTGSVVLLPAGKYRVTSLIRVNKSITVRGAGMGQTIVWKSNGSKRDVNIYGPGIDSNPAGIFYAGNSEFPAFLNAGTIALTANGVQDATTVSVASGHGLTAGQFVEVSEDQFYAGGQFVSLPPTGAGSGVPTLYEVWKNDRIFWSYWRQPVGAASISSSNATSDVLTSAAVHSFTSSDIGLEVYVSGHSGTFSPNATNGIYVIESVPSTTTITLREVGTGTHIDVTSAGSGGTFYANRAFTDFRVGPVDPLNSALTWFARGNGYYYGEVKEIASVTATSVTFTTGLTDSYRTAKAAAIAVSNTTFLQNVGFEDMTLWQGSNWTLSFRGVARGWAKNIEVLEWGGHGLEVTMSHKIQIEGCYIHYGAYPQPGGGGYAFVMSNHSSNVLFWDNITRDTNKNIVSNVGGAGSVVAYNVFQDSRIWNSDSWVEVGANGSHMSGSHHTLFEGNRASNFDSDDSHGTSYSHTVLRNWLTGHRDNFDYDGFQQNVRTIGLSAGSMNFSFVGNVQGRPGKMSGWTFDAGTNWFLDDDKVIWKLGYTSGPFNQHADQTWVLNTAIKEGNYDYLTNSQQWVSGPSTIPDSYFLSAKPAFFGSCPWPWIDAGGTTKTFVLPAQIRYDAGMVYDRMTDPCNGPQPRWRQKP